MEAEVCVWRDIEVVGVGDVLRGLFARALVWAILTGIMKAVALPRRTRCHVCVYYCSTYYKAVRVWGGG